MQLQHLQQADLKGLQGYKKISASPVDTLNSLGSCFHQARADETSSGLKNGESLCAIILLF